MIQKCLWIFAGATDVEMLPTKDSFRHQLVQPLTYPRPCGAMSSMHNETVSGFLYIMWLSRLHAAYTVVQISQISRMLLLILNQKRLLTFSLLILVCLWCKFYTTGLFISLDGASYICRQLCYSPLVQFKFSSFLTWFIFRQIYFEPFHVVA